LNDGSEKSVVVEDADLRTLDDGTWVNDVVISYFIHEFIPLNADILVLDCQFFASLKMYKELHGDDFAAYLKYRGLSRMVYWPGFKYIQIPVNMDSHWSFVVLEQLDRGVYAAVHIDSLRGMHDKHRVTSLISTYLRHEYQHKYDMRTQGITTTTSVPCNPQQGNGYDCGAFVMYYLLKVNKALHKMEEKDLQTIAIESCRGLSQSKCAGFRELLRNLLTENGSARTD
jgi:Ulp1 family protease